MKRSSEGRYANMPDEAVPYRRFTKPYYDWFVREDTLQYNGAADQRPDGEPAQLHEIAIGFMSPLENNPVSIFGLPELHGVQLAKVSIKLNCPSNPGLFCKIHVKLP